MVEIVGTRSAGPYAWAFGYALDLSADALTVALRVHFDEPLPGWEWEIEQVWSGQAFVLVGDEAPVPIVLDVIETGPETAHQVVDVVHGRHGRTDMTTWYVASMDERAAAHEVGHMLGLYDEYEGGATLAVGHDTLMSDLGPVMPDYFTGIAPGFDLVAPAPSTGGKDVIAEYRAADGGPGADRITGTAKGDRLSGGDGSDVIVGGAGDDIIIG